jgi:hypothetical protein
MVSDPGFIDLDHLTHRILVTHPVAPSFYEEAITPESAKDSARYLTGAIASAAEAQRSRNRPDNPPSRAQLGQCPS